MIKQTHENYQITSHGRALALKLSSESARPAFIREHRLAPWLIVATVCFGAFMGQLDASIVTLAFPALQHQFNTHLAGVEWVSLTYLITLIILLIPIGKFSDRHGRKLMYLYGFVIFTAASMLCGFAPSLGVLVLLRVLQAAGAAMLQANSVALVATSVSANRKRAALGIQTAAQSLGLALGPVLGGILVASVGWRWIFFINVPVGIIAIVAGWFLLPRTREHAPRQRSDVPGLLLLAASVITSLVLLSSISGLGLSIVETAVLAIMSIAAIAGLLWREHHTTTPIIDFKMLKSTRIAHMLAGALFAYMVLFGPLVLFPQVLAANGSSVLKAGLLLSALPAGFGIAAIGAERLLPRQWHDRTRAILGALLACVSSALLALPLPEALRLLFLGLLGTGLGIYIPANNAGIMSSVTKHQAAVAGGMVNIARGLGTAFGVAVVTLALNATNHHSINTGKGVAMVLLASAALAATWAGRHIKTDIEHTNKSHAEFENL